MTIFTPKKKKTQVCLRFPDLHPSLFLISRRANVSDHEDGWQIALEWPASTSTMSTIKEASLTMSARSVQRRRSALGVVAMPQKLLVNGGSDRWESHAPAGKMKLNPISLNASEMMCLFALVRGPVYSLTPPAFHSLCRSINISQLPGWPQTLIWVKQRFLRAHEGGNWRSAHNSITDAAHRIYFFFCVIFFQTFLFLLLC